MIEKRILLIGSTGQVGWELLHCLQPLGQVFPTTRTQAAGSLAVDLAQPNSIRQVIREIKPTVIINAAAYTAVDQAEQESELAYAINATAPGILAEEAYRLGAILVHYSTDYVFSGQHARPYKEQDTVNPINVYGTSKLAGEHAIQAVGGYYFILRTAWVYGLRGKNFLLTMQRLAQEKETLNIVADQVGSPTWSKFIAQATALILAQLSSRCCASTGMGALKGVYHLTCANQTTWYAFAQAIVSRLEKRPQILPITTAEYPTPAKRPSYSVLSNTKIQETFNITLPAWDKALALCLNA
jgi:dTDP-4-dehydrorhamnose reductase